MKFKTVLKHPLLKSSLIYVISDSINKAVPFNILPILIYYLLPSDYGIVANFGVLLSIFIMIGVNGAITVKYFKEENIRVNTISLGGLEDGQPISFLNAYKEFCLNKGMLHAKDISGSLLFLLSDNSKYVNGQNLIVDDGFTL